MSSGPVSSGLTASRVNLALAALFLGTFVLGSAELLVVGVLDLIAKDMAVSISTAGTLVTAYALGISIGGPLLTALSMRFGRRALLWLSLAAYVAGNALAAVAATFGMLILARVVTGSLHGLFIGVAFAIATSLVPPQRMGRAISIVIAGIAVSTALGVPLGTLIGQAFGWHAGFTAIVAFGVVALAAALAFIPPVRNGNSDGFAAQARHALAPPVLAVLAVGFLLIGGQYAALTYITPYLQNVTGISGGLISIFLFAYGAATAIGTFAGGWAADRSAPATLVGANLVLILALGGLYLAGSIPWLVAVTMGLWGVVGFGLVPALQYRVVSLAGPGRDFAATLPASAVTAGIAVGALVGGWAIDAYGPAGAVVTGLLTCAVALPITWATGWLRAPMADGQGPNAAAAMACATCSA